MLWGAYGAPSKTDKKGLTHVRKLQEFLWRAHQWPPLFPGTQSLWLCPDHLEGITFKIIFSYIVFFELQFFRGTWKEKHNSGLILAPQWFCIEPDRSRHSPPTPPSRVHPGHCAMYSGKSNNLVVIAIWSDLIHLMISSCTAPRCAAVVNLKEFDVIRMICLLGVQFYDRPECGGLDKVH